MSARPAGWLLMAAVLLAGCTTSADPAAGPGEDRSSLTAPAGSEPAQASAAERVPGSDVPAEGACYRLSYAEATEPTNRDRPVDCGDRHTAQTIHVGTLATVVDGHAVAVDSDHVQGQMARACPRELADHLGGDQEALDLSRFEVVWFSPTIEESDGGARWFRCDVVALAAAETLAVLPAPGRLRGILDTAEGRTRFGLCGTAAPGDDDFERVICARQHAWRAFSTIPLSGGRPYPGAPAVRRAGEAPCSDRARAEAADPLRYEYGWEWPTAEQWRAGQRFGYCWLPD